MDQYFTQISKIVGNKKTSARIRFMLLDVEDLRKVSVLETTSQSNPLL